MVNQSTQDVNPADTARLGESTFEPLEVSQNNGEEIDSGIDASIQSSLNTEKVKMERTLRIPDFISDKKSYKQWDKDITIWSNLCGLAEKQKAQWIVLHLEGHPSGIKEKIMDEIGEKLGLETGMTELKTFIKGIYDGDDFAESYECYLEFERIKRNEKELVREFIPRWDNMVSKMTKLECVIPDKLLCFKLLSAIDCDTDDVNHVIAGIDYEEGKTKKNLHEQAKASIKKFMGRNKVKKNIEPEKPKPKLEGTYITHEQLTYILDQHAKGAQKRGAVDQGEGDKAKKLKSGLNPNYKGKKNPLDPKDGLPFKCWDCRCDCAENCVCPCRYHMKNECPKKKGEKTYFVMHQEKNVWQTSNDVKIKIDENGVPCESREIVPIQANLNQLAVYLTADKELDDALFDCGCPRTVVGIAWVYLFLKLKQETSLEHLYVEKSSRIYRFGGGETRDSLGIIEIPCKWAGKNIKIRSEVVNAGIPLLIGNTTLEAMGGNLNFEKRIATLMGVDVEMPKTDSGHFKVNIKRREENDQFQIKEENMVLFFSQECDDMSKAKREFLETEMCLIMQDKPLNQKNIKRLHQYLGHAGLDKIEKLISNAGKLDDKVRLEKSTTLLLIRC